MNAVGVWIPFDPAHPPALTEECDQWKSSPECLVRWIDQDDLPCYSTARWIDWDDDTQEWYQPIGGLFPVKGEATHYAIIKWPDIEGPAGA